jgi:hypothetical protein
LVDLVAREPPPDWDEDLCRFPVHAPFQRAGWMAARAATSGSTVFVSGPGYQAACLLTGTSTRPVLVCTRGPAFRDGESLERAIHDLRRVANGSELLVGPYRTGAADVRPIEGILSRLECRPTGTQFHRATAVVALDDEAAMLARLSQSARRQLRRAGRAGAEVLAGTSRADARRFVDFYADFARRRAIPAIEESFAIRLADWFERTGAGTYLFLESAGELRSAALVLTAGELGWMSRSPTASREPLGACLYWSALCWMRDRGCRQADLGGVHSRSDGKPLMNGLTQFKLSLGATLTPVVDEHVMLADGGLRGLA